MGLGSRCGPWRLSEPFDFEEIKAKFGDVSVAFVCNGDLSKALFGPTDEEFDGFRLEKESSIGLSEGIGG